MKYKQHNSDNYRLLYQKTYSEGFRSPNYTRKFSSHIYSKVNKNIYDRLFPIVNRLRKLIVKNN